MGDGLPTLVTDPTVVRLGERNAPRSCSVCGGDAAFYVFVTDREASRRLGTGLSPDEWPINAFLCREDFAAAPRVESLAEHPAV